MAVKDPAASPTARAERVWPENGLSDLPSATLPELKNEPSFDTRALMNSLEKVRVKYWPNKPNTQ